MSKPKTQIELHVALSGDAAIGVDQFSDDAVTVLKVNTADPEKTMAKDPVAFAERHMTLPLGTWVGCATWVQR